MKKIVILFVTVVMIATAAFVFSRRSPVLFTFEPQPRAVLETAGLDNTRRPVVAVTENGNIYMLAVAGDLGRLMLTMSHDGGDTFMPPQVISPEGVRVSANGQNAPSLYVRAMSTYAVWQQITDERSDIVFARSQGMHKPFSQPVRITDKPLSDTSFSAFSVMGVAPNGDIYIAWLDDRDKAEPPGTFSLYLAKSADQGATFSKNLRVATAVCPCCRPSLAFGEAGELYLAWRKVFDGDVRDIVVAVSRDGSKTFSEPVKAGEDHWVLHACPDVGPSLAVRGNRVYAAWMSEGKGRPGIRLSYSDDGGRTFAQPMIVSRGVVDATHPALVNSADELLLTFQGRAERSDAGWGKFRPYLVKINPSGQTSEPQATGAGEASAAYPAVASPGARKALLAWTEHGKKKSRVLLQRVRW